MVDSMATLNNGLHTKVDRVEIDTKAPFESVKAAVSLFGEKGIADQIYKKNLEIRAEKGQISKDSQLHILQKEFLKLKEQLESVETTKAQAQDELKKIKEIASSLSLKLEDVTQSRKKAIEASEIAHLHAKELEASNDEGSKGKIADWQSELSAARYDQLAATAELEAAKQELRKLKQEFQACMDAKVYAVKQAEEAMSKMEMNSHRADELSKEINKAQKSHFLFKLAYMEAEKAKNSIRAEREGEAQKACAEVQQIRKQILAVAQDLAAAKDLEKELAATTAAVEKMKNELNLAKESEAKVCHDACHPIEKLKKVKEDIENTKKRESDALSSVELKASEFSQAEEDLKKATEQACALKASMDSLKAELERKKIELAELNETEAQAEAKAADLNSELLRARLKLEAAIAAEAKAKDATASLSQTIQNLSAEADRARKDAESMNEEAQKAKLEIEQAKAEIITISSRLESACKELEEAKAAEATAVKQIKDLSDRANAVRASTSESGAVVTISLSEFDSLSRKVDEANKLADKKVAAAMAQIDAIKAGEHETSMKLKVAYREIEGLKSAEQEELRKANMATAAKKAIEGELIRWREREQQKKAAPRRTTSDFPISEKDNVSISFLESKIVHSGPLLKELNVNNLPGKQENLWSESFSLKKNKKQFMPNIRRLFTRKKRVGSSLR